MGSTVAKKRILPDRAGRVRHVTMSQQQRSIGVENSSQDEKGRRACILGFWTQTGTQRSLAAAYADPVPECGRGGSLDLCGREDVWMASRARHDGVTGGE